MTTSSIPRCTPWSLAHPSGVLLLALSAVGLPSLASAQALSLRERAFTRSVAKQLGKEIGSVRGIENKTDGRGVEIRFKDGTTLTRLRYPNPIAAMNHSARYKGSGQKVDPPVAVQVRGRQAVLLQGKDVGDPAVTRKLLDAAWSGLAGGKNPVAMTGLLEGDESAGQTGPEGPLYDMLGEKIAAGQKSGKATSDGDGTHRWKSEGDEVTIMSQTPKGGSFVVAKTPESAQKLVERLQALTKVDPLEPAPQPSDPTVTAAAPPTPTQPKPTQPKPTQPKPTQPKPTQPKPTKAPILGEPYKGATNRINSLFD